MLVPEAENVALAVAKIAVMRDDEVKKRDVEY